jgi:hypothetical protein
MKTDDAERPLVPPTGGVAPAPADGRAWYPARALSFTAVFALRDLGPAGLVVLALALLGVPLGLLWTAVAPHASVLVTPEGAVFADHRPEVFVGADGTLGAIGIGAGFVVGAAVFLWRRQRGPWMAIGVALGSLAGAAVAWKVGHQIGLSSYNRLLEQAPAGRAFDRPVDLKAGGILFVQPIVAVIVYVLAAGWSRFGDLGRVPAPAGAGAVSSGSAVPAAPPAEPAPPPAGGASSPPA